MIQPGLMVILGVLLNSFFVQKKSWIDPTGTYKLDNKTTRKNGDIYGYSGQIQVKKVSAEKIVMTFDVNKGAPSYNSGSFVDTLKYKDNRAVFGRTEFDPTCQITFDFNEKGVIVKEKTADYNSACGFGHAVVADGFYKRISNKLPVLRDPSTGEKLNK